MRTIKFRGMDGSTRKWCYGDFEYNSKYDIARIHTYNADGEYDCQYIVLPDTVGQYTGLCDYVGKEVFEGDILRVHFGGNSFVGSVEYYGCNACFVLLVGGTRYGFPNIVPSDIEILGNVYENSELLTQK